MRRIYSLPEYKDSILEEIISNNHQEWWVPKNNTHTIFERARMKFINRNLEYFDFQNMVNVAYSENKEYNPAFPKLLEFCKNIGLLTNSHGPFGRMCVWKIPPGMYIEPHRDNFEYHRAINRWIYFVNLDENVTYVRIGKEIIESVAGTLFEFSPATEMHSFKNTSNEDWYFIGFDFWYTDVLELHSPNSDLPKYQSLD